MMILAKCLMYGKRYRYSLIWEEKATEHVFVIFRGWELSFMLMSLRQGMAYSNFRSLIRSQSYSIALIK